MNKPFFIIDFDSTFTKIEALDLLCEIVLEGDPRKEEVSAQMAEITNRGMDGSLDFRTSLSQRMALLQPHRRHIEALAEALKGQVSDSFRRNADFIVSHREQVYVVSNGFKDFIVPVVEYYGLLPNQVYANEFTYDETGNVVGFNEEIPLSRSGGKPIVIRDLNLSGEVVVIGDGYNDFEIREQGYASKFYLFTENVTRAKVLEIADHIAPSVDEILYELKMSRSLSYPKNRINVLLLEGVHKDAIKIFEGEGYNVEYLETALNEEELCERIKDINIIGIRSKTHITEKVIESAKRLINIGAFCIGTNQIDLEAASRHGVTVFNAPYMNTRSVVELAIAQIVFLVRNLPDKMMAMHQGRWEKSATGAFEVRSKKLGIIGYGNIGSQLSVLAEAMGLDVYYYDLEDKMPLGNATKCNSLEELLGTVEILSLHIDGRPSNTNFFGEEQFNMMRDGSIFINLARGKTVQIPALKAALESGKIKGCAVDVFPKEPKSNDEPFESELMGMPNTILTPHIGGSTYEAQMNIGNYVPNKVIQYINTGSTSGSVNMPQVSLSAVKNAHRLLHIHHNVPNVMASINNVLSKNGVNIVGQYLKTNENMGYVITDIDKEYDEDTIHDLREIDGTIWMRVLY